MEKLKTQEVYTTRAQYGSEHSLTINLMVNDGRLDKHPNMILISPEELEARERKMAEEAFEAGVSFGMEEYSTTEAGEKNEAPDKEQYLTSIFK